MALPLLVSKNRVSQTLEAHPEGKGKVEELFVPQCKVFEMMYNAITMAATLMPSDVRVTLSEYLARETNPIAKLHLETIIRNCDVSEREGRLICPDTGWPLFYVRAGDNVTIEGGFSSLYAASKEAVRQATGEGKLRPNMVHPLTRVNTNVNVGNYFPKVEIRFDPAIDFFEIIAVPKGGGSEIFGSFYRMMYPADGRKGVLKFILDCIRESTYAGKTCPPNVLGIGIGGTADVCIKMAKEAAILRPLGSRHPDHDIAAMEVELAGMVMDSGVGPMGMGGRSGILDVHIEYAVTHTAALPVAFNAQCSLSRRKVARYTSDGRISYGDIPEWAYR